MSFPNTEFNVCMILRSRTGIVREAEQRERSGTSANKIFRKGHIVSHFLKSLDIKICHHVLRLYGYGYNLRPTLNSPNDIRGPGREDDDDKPLYSSNKDYVSSWIWLVPRLPNDAENSQNDVTDHSLCTEWTKAKARQDCWEEEYLLIQEEMRRVIVYLNWKASWWRTQAH